MPRLRSTNLLIETRCSETMFARIISIPSLTYLLIDDCTELSVVEHVALGSLSSLQSLAAYALPSDFFDDQLFEFWAPARSLIDITWSSDWRDADVKLRVFSRLLLRRNRTILHNVRVIAFLIAAMRANANNPLANSLLYVANAFSEYADDAKWIISRPRGRF
eukprot:TRINITY_DN637_c0_g1_i1.p1 TRINITY_DN637_c0_g1~~TRINITY_DN637_c0_g1_i1.p1  ORF type:complete len:172 (-),score=15.56 TRINITY_DN637_c0_g1_i1:136-624(-)